MLVRNNPAVKRSLNLLWGHEVVSQQINWIWKPWLPRGMVIVLDGDPGVGKSSLVMDLVARITNGQLFPGETAPHEPTVAMIVPMEDPIDSIVKPRFEAAGGDLKRVAFFGGVKEAGAEGEGEWESVLQLPRDLELIADLCRQQRPAIVVIDPFFAVLGMDENGRYVMANDDQSVRQLFIRLKRLAEETGVLFVLIRHLNKGGHGNAVVRGAGSIGISASARAVLLNWVFVCPGGLIRIRGDEWESVGWSDVARFQDMSFSTGSVTIRQCRIITVDGNEWGFQANWIAKFGRLAALLCHKIEGRN